MGLIGAHIQCFLQYSVRTLDFLHNPLDMILVFLVVVHSPSILRPPVASRVDPAGNLVTPCSRPRASATRGRNELPMDGINHQRRHIFNDSVLTDLPKIC